MAPIKANYKHSLSLWQLKENNAFRVMNTVDFITVLCRYQGDPPSVGDPLTTQHLGAWHKSITAPSIREAFRVTSIFPLCPAERQEQRDAAVDLPQGVVKAEGVVDSSQSQRGDKMERRLFLRVVAVLEAEEGEDGT